MHGAVSSINGSFMGVCGSELDGSLSVTGASQFVVIGDPGDDGCPSNELHGAVVLTSDHGGAELVRNQISGSVSVIDVSGTGPFPGDVGASIEANSIKGSLQCAANVPRHNNGNTNTVRGARIGQCSNL